MIARSGGLPPVNWLRHYLDAYLRPLVHCFYVHDLAFMPHGENVILVLRDDVPQRVLMKDIAEEIVLMNAITVLPPEVERIRDPGDEDLNRLAIFTDVFDCFFRFLSAVLVSEDMLSEDDFWSAVADCIADFQAQTPELAERFGRQDLFADRYNRQMIDLQRQSEQLVLVGTMDNPLAAHRPADRVAARPSA
jgi:siderophore synthetase component